MKKNGVQIGLENAETLRNYLIRLKSDGKTLPLRGGQVNRTEIANQCGFRRQVFHENPACASLLDQALKDFKVEEIEIEPGPSVTDEEKDRKIRKLEQRLTDLQERLDAAEKENDELREYRAIYEMAIGAGGQSE